MKLKEIKPKNDKMYSYKNPSEQTPNNSNNFNNQIPTL